MYISISTLNSLKRNFVNSSPAKKPNHRNLTLTRVQFRSNSRTGNHIAQTYTSDESELVHAMQEPHITRESSSFSGSRRAVAGKSHSLAAAENYYGEFLSRTASALASISHPKGDSRWLYMQRSARGRASPRGPGYRRSGLMDAGWLLGGLLGRWTCARPEY